MVGPMANPVASLLRQHDELLARLDATVARLAALTAPLRELLAYLETEVDGHFVVEEQVLFPKLAGSAAVAPEAIPLFVEEHAAARAHARALGEALQHGTVACQVAAAEALIDLLRAHVAKEDAMLLAVAAVTPHL